MTSYRIPRLSTGKIEFALLALALLWYRSFYTLFTSVKNGLDAIPMGWLVLVAFGPVLSAALGFALDRSLKAAGRPMRLWEIMLVVFVTPQFVGALYVWSGVFHYMGFY
ncbi:MAG: hypothetical protein JWR69_2162 [Pedosphaera sp.]|nr:hypothetical protein [Pedosphaera sp.]